MAYTTIPASSGGGGGVTSAIAGAGISVSGATGDVTFTNASPFGTNTTLTALNSAASPVNVWQGIASLSTSTAGAEVSQYVVKLLDGTGANHQVTAFTFLANQVQAPNGFGLTPFVNPGFQFGTSQSGMGYSPTGGTGGTAALGFSLTGGAGSGNATLLLDNNGDLTISGATRRINFGSGRADYVLNASGGGLIINTSQGGSSAIAIQINTTPVITVTQAKSVVVGAALATNATDGFLYIPTCAGTPTGTPTTQTGTVALVFNTSANKLMVYDGGWLGATVPGTFV